jgi:hypothetical protein
VALPPAPPPPARAPPFARPVPGTATRLEGTAEAQRCVRAARNAPRPTPLRKRLSAASEHEKLRSARDEALPPARALRRHRTASRSGLDVLFRRAASVMLGLSDRVASSLAAWDPTGTHLFFQARPSRRRQRLRRGRRGRRGARGASAAAPAKHPTNLDGC